MIPLFLTVQKLHLFNTMWALVLPYAASAQPLLVLLHRGFFDQTPVSCWRARGSTAARNAGCCGRSSSR